MKFLSGVVFAVFWCLPVCFSQSVSNDTFHLVKPPPQGILLDKGWRFHAGDDSVWANPGFSDNDWDTVNPDQDILRINQLQKTHIGWFRLKFQVDSALFDQTLGMLVSQAGASEIYLNGKLLYKFGQVGTQKNKEALYRLSERPFSIQLDSRKVQTLAVRYSFLSRGFLVKSTEFQNDCLRISINDIGATYASYQKQSRLKLIYEICQICFWLALGLISGSLFYSYRFKRIYRDVCFFSTAELLGGTFSGLIAVEVTNTNWSSFMFWIGRGFGCLGLIYALHVICVLFQQKKGWYYYLLMFLLVLVFMSFPILYEVASSIGLLVLFLFSLEYSRRSWRAFRQGYPGAIVLFSAQIIFFLTVIMDIILIKAGKEELAQFIIFLGVVNIPICWSLFMAGEYARTGVALQTQIKEVELLSREKQQLLITHNETLEKKVTERTSQLNESLRNLQTAQAQLIQSEKMASLGELTAGIAHEIQNPLNFVNNFSEVNTELIDELQSELKTGNSNEAILISNDIKANEQKINQHGKRADAIVKGMLQHSRGSGGEEEATNINVLADEYLRISYRGFCAKDDSFSITIRKDLDTTIGTISIVPQDIGRVLLNLYNNAFYALTMKKKLQSKDYEPTLYLSTLKTDGKIEIRVKDNGDGIQRKVLDKIFQPFFTTKPTGQGTGLGLSLSYDIVKAHGGEIEVKTKEGEFAEFIIRLSECSQFL